MKTSSLTPLKRWESRRPRFGEGDEIPRLSWDLSRILQCSWASIQWNRCTRCPIPWKRWESLLNQPEGRVASRCFRGNADPIEERSW